MFLTFERCRPSNEREGNKILFMKIVGAFHEELYCILNVSMDQTFNWSEAHLSLTMLPD